MLPTRWIRALALPVLGDGATFFTHPDSDETTVAEPDRRLKFRFRRLNGLLGCAFSF